MSGPASIKIEWTNALTVEFITLFESHPVLWDPQHGERKNRNRQYDAWNKIAKDISVDVTIEVLKKKKDGLMTTYRSLAKKVQDSSVSGAGSQDVYKPTWFAFEMIDRFIRAGTMKIPSLSSEDTRTEELPEMKISTNESDIEIIDIEESSFSSQPTLPKRKKTTTSNNVDFIAQQMKVARDASTILSNNTQSVCDENSLFGMFVSEKVRKLPRNKQKKAQRQIFLIISDLEMSEEEDENQTE